MRPEADGDGEGGAAGGADSSGASGGEGASYAGGQSGWQIPDAGSPAPPQPNPALLAAAAEASARSLQFHVLPLITACLALYAAA